MSGQVRHRLGRAPRDVSDGRPSSGRLCRPSVAVPIDPRHGGRCGSPARRSVGAGPSAARPWQRLSAPHLASPCRVLRRRPVGGAWSAEAPSCGRKPPQRRPRTPLPSVAADECDGAASPKKRPESSRGACAGSGCACGSPHGANAGGFAVAAVGRRSDGVDTGSRLAGGGSCQASAPGVALLGACSPTGSPCPGWRCQRPPRPPVLCPVCAG
jgi:hypothetical protein